MEIKRDISLKELNTFGINVKANQFIEIKSVHEAIELFQSAAFKKQKHLFIGGGSNILLRSNFDGLVIKNSIRGIEKEESTEGIKLHVGAGENWHQFVMYCVNNGYAGLENLSLIPGSVGASPMQNIGAYGVEVKDSILEVKAVELKTGEIHNFNNAECQFEYRSSIFKTSHRDQYLIVSVSFLLKRKPEFKTSYGAIQDELIRMGIDESNLSIQAVSEAVINIRRSKLPDPEEIGNSGSFFKNPVVNREKYLDLKKSFPNIPGYEQADGNFKLAAGWLIEKAGWKGFRKGDYGVHEKQALVLVNYGGASGNEIYDLSEQIMKDVNSKYQILLEREVNII